MMSLSFTIHARHQLQERLINEKEVLAAINAPDSVRREGDRVVYQKLTRVGGKQYLLRVFVIEGVYGMRVLTVYLTSKIAKYL